MKTWRSEGIAPPLLTSALDGGEWSASRLCHFTPRETAPGTRWIGGWVGLKDGLDAMPCQETNPDRPTRSPSLYRLSYFGFCISKM
jgi:hypothetical protein